MENQVGVCTSCGMAVNLPHTCTADHKFLGQTDWKVTRHRDQLALGIETTLSPGDFVILLEERQSARERIAAEA